MALVEPVVFAAVREGRSGHVGKYHNKREDWLGGEAHFEKGSRERVRARMSEERNEAKKGERGSCFGGWHVNGKEGDSWFVGCDFGGRGKEWERVKALAR